MVNLTRAKRISGWMTDKELEFLAETAKKSNVTIEIGSYYGRSCMAMADNTKGFVVSVDPYQGVYSTMNPNIALDFNEEVYKDFLYNLSEHLETGKVRHIRSTFDKVPNNFKADFVFIDGDHSYEGCLNDIMHAKKFVDGGIIAGHDWDTPGFQGIVQAVRESLGEPNVVDTIWWVQA